MVEATEAAHFKIPNKRIRTFTNYEENLPINIILFKSMLELSQNLTYHIWHKNMQLFIIAWNLAYVRTAFPISRRNFLCQMWYIKFYLYSSINNLNSFKLFNVWVFRPNIVHDY